jgi:hypothetical protein
VRCSRGRASVPARIGGDANGFGVVIKDEDFEPDLSEQRRLAISGPACASGVRVPPAGDELAELLAKTPSRSALTFLDELIGGWLRALADAGRLDRLLTSISIDGKWRTCR